MKKPVKTISGSGGGGGSNKGAPTEERNSLRSIAYGKVLDLVSEGEIEGLVNGAQSIYLNETVLENPNGTRNFSGVTYESVNGTQSQSSIIGFAATEAVTQVFQRVTVAAPVIKTITNPDATAARVTMGVPQLSFQDPVTGNLSGYSVDFAIYIQSNGGGYQLYAAAPIVGKTLSRYQRSVRVDLPAGQAPWDIKLVRLTADAPTSNIQNDLYFDSITEIIDARFRYPNSALVGLRFDSSQFSNVPNRAYDMKLLKVKLPSNSTTKADGTLSYSGIWDGTWRVGWTTNPAWCFYDLLTNDRYGLGKDFDTSLVDKWALYTIGRYCDQTVKNGFGGFEPRFTCNIYFMTREESYKVLQDMAAVFRAMTYWAGGSITVSQDAPSDPVYLYTPANVIDGNFSYVGASMKARHTVALVSWNDPEDFFRQKVEYVEDTAAIAKYGVIQTEIYATGCTSRGQANRVGRWLLYTEQNESESVQFKTGVEGAICRPGQIISVADPARAGTRLGGRVSSATTTQVTIDSEITASTNGAIFYVMQADGTVESSSVVEVIGQVVTLATALSVAPVNGAIWLMSTTAIEAQTFRVLSVIENDQGQYEVTALASDPRKYDAVENGLILEPRSISELSVVPDSPASIKLTESLYQSQAEVKVKLTVSWDTSPTAASYLVQYRESTSNWIELPETASNDIDILDVQPGIYEVSVVALSAVGKRSPAATASTEVYGKLALPGNVVNFSLIPVQGIANLSWDKSVDLDVIVGGNVRIRHTPLTTGQDWINAIDIIPALPGSATQAQAPLLAGTYMAKFFDSSGLQSETMALIVTTVPEGIALNVIITDTESPGFAGTKTNCEILGGGLTLTSSTLWDAMLGNIDDQISVDTLGGFASTASYLFAAVTDFGGVYTSRVTANILLTAYAIDDYIDARGNVDSWGYVDGAIVDDVFARLYMRTTLDDPSGSPVWTVWKPFVIGEYTARGIQFKLEMGTADSTHNLVVTTLSLSIDVPDRIATARDITSGTSTYSVAYVEPFYALPSVNITAMNMATGDTYAITNQTVSGFDILFKNSGGTNVSRKFDYLAKGYGRKVG